MDLRLHLIVDEIISKEEERSAWLLYKKISQEIRSQQEKGDLFRKKTYVDIWIHNASELEVDLGPDNEPRKIKITLNPMVFVSLSSSIRAQLWASAECKYPCFHVDSNNDSLRIRLKGC